MEEIDRNVQKHFQLEENKQIHRNFPQHRTWGMTGSSQFKHKAKIK